MRGQTLADLRHPGARARGPEPTTTRSEEERIACGPLIYFSKKPHNTLLETSTVQDKSYISLALFTMPPLLL